ncbi:hypothetical protein SLS53_003286 [Cytospora paraplurivora]|uniref:Heterokaryon incompatibility domain-containing protein n=1 Tax=Cytospora paraplurivora TaxID=2898453 RepID=A0AAN9UDT5_9PEZI
MSATAIEDDAPTFSYEALPDAGSYIRLLAILNYDEAQPIPVHCELTAWPISEVPKYHAVSYTWGDPNHTATILVNGQRMQVRQNCEYTLKQATWYGGDFRRRFYWVDAICINQGSNEEKGPQVSLMGQVYGNAERVLACVGKDDPWSRYLYRRARRDMSFFSDMGLVTEDSDDVQEVMERWMSKLGPALVKLGSAAARFTSRPYFERVWIYQELFLGRQISVCCGKWHIPFRVLRGSYIAGIFHHNAYTRGFKGWRQYLEEDFDRQVSIDIYQQLIRAGALGMDPTTLWTALYTVSIAECADPRDKVYGILSTVDWSNKTPIRPDYTKDRLHVAIETLKIVTSDGDWRGEWLQSVNVVLENLQVSEETTPGMREAIERRRLAQPGQSTKIDQGQLRGLAEYYGWRLEPKHWGEEQEGDWDSDAADNFDYSAWAQRQEHQEQPASVTAYDSTQYALPSVARPGDWVLAHDLYLPPLVARPRSDGLYDIVGYAAIQEKLYDYWHERLPELPNFGVRMDVEDAIVYVNDREVDRLDSGVCGYPGSSYAQPIVYLRHADGSNGAACEELPFGHMPQLAYPFIGRAT